MRGNCLRRTSAEKFIFAPLERVRKIVVVGGRDNKMTRRSLSTGEQVSHLSSIQSNRIGTQPVRYRKGLLRLGLHTACAARV